MNKISKPTHNGCSDFINSSKNKKLKTYPNLLKLALRAERLAQHYDSAGGDPNVLRIGRISDDEKSAILYLYDHPPKSMDYIEKLRATLAGEICPMCGGENPTTLDHYLMKRTYPEYALLSYNLVPACSCNLKRGTKLKNATTGARILHPYYDQCMSGPLIKLRFDPRDVVPTFRVKYMLAPTDPNFRNLKFHVENIVLKTNFLTYITKRWRKVKLMPNHTLAGHSAHRSTKDNFHQYLLDLSASKCTDEGFNSWASIFLRSISSRTISDWLFDNT